MYMYTVKNVKSLNVMIFTIINTNCVCSKHARNLFFICLDSVVAVVAVGVFFCKELCIIMYVYDVRIIFITLCTRSIVHWHTTNIYLFS